VLTALIAEENNDSDQELVPVGGGGNELNLGTLRTLRSDGWTDGGIVDSYLHIIRRSLSAAARPDEPGPHIMDTHFFRSNIIRQRNGEAYTYEPARGYNLPPVSTIRERIYIPVNMGDHRETIGLGDHWRLFVVEPVQRRIILYDSLSNREARAQADAIADFLSVLLVRDGVSAQVDCNYFEARSPIQTNSFDCGIFMLSTIDFLTRGITPTYTHRDVPEFRLQIGESILENNPQNYYGLQPTLSRVVDALDDTDRIFAEVDDNPFFENEAELVSTLIGLETNEEEDEEEHLLNKEGEDTIDLRPAIPPTHSLIELHNWVHGISEYRKRKARRGRLSELNESRMLVCLDGQQIDYYTRHATMKDQRRITYHCNTCETAIRSRDTILATEWSKEVPIRTLLIDALRRPSYYPALTFRAVLIV
jgi:hypothetical protein